eukprot:7712314-Pyramimonas_sp.AAC.2
MPTPILGFTQPKAKVETRNANTSWHSAMTDRLIACIDTVMGAHNAQYVRKRLAAKADCCLYR